MKIDRVTYQKIFPTGMMYLNHKIGVEVQVDDNDDWEEAFTMAKNFVEAMNANSNPSMGVTTEYFTSSGLNSGTYDHKTGIVTFPSNTPEKEPELTPEDGLISLIGYTTNVKLLEKLRPQVEKINTYRCYEVYNNKINELNGLDK